VVVFIGHHLGPVATVQGMRRLVAVVLVLVVACSDDSDAGVEAACREFEAIAADAQAGVLTPSEMQSRSRKVYELAQGSESSDFRDAAAALARDVNNPDSGVIPRFGDECDART
jgi:hypothetical protein